MSGTLSARISNEPVPEAIVEVTATARSGFGGSPETFIVTATANGRYTVTGLRGTVSVRVTKTGFYPTAATVVLDRDRTLDFVMDVAQPGLPDGGDLVLGQTIQSSLGPNDPRCDPLWDRNSPCRRFGFVPTSNGPYVFTVQPVGLCAELELHVFNEVGARLALMSAFGSFKVDAGLFAGRTYEIRLMAYYSCDRFELTVN